MRRSPVLIALPLALAACGEVSRDDPASNRLGEASSPSTGEPAPQGMNVDGIHFAFTVDLPGDWRVRASAGQREPHKLDRLIAEAPNGTRAAVIVQQSQLRDRKPDPDVELAALDRMLVREEGAQDIRSDPPSDGRLGPLAGRTRRAVYTARGALVAETTVLAVTDDYLYSATALASADQESAARAALDRVISTFRPAP